MSAKFIATPIIYGNYGNCVDAFQIRALRDIPMHGIKAGDIGGVLLDKDSLSQEGECWVKVGSIVETGSVVKDNAYIDFGVRVSENSLICGNSQVFGGDGNFNHTVIRSSFIYGNARVKANAEGCKIGGYSSVYLHGHLLDKVIITPAFCDVIKPSPEHFPLNAYVMEKDRKDGYVHSFIKLGVHEHEFLLKVFSAEYDSYRLVDPRDVVIVKRSGLTEPAFDEMRSSKDNVKLDLLQWHEEVASAIETNYGIKPKCNKVYCHELDHPFDNNFFKLVMTHLKKQHTTNFSYARMFNLMIKQTWIKEIKVYDKHFGRFVSYYEVDKKKAKKFIKANFNRFLLNKHIILSTLRSDDVIENMMKHLSMEG